MSDTPTPLQERVAQLCNPYQGEEGANAVRMLAEEVGKVEQGLADAQYRIRTLIEERDSARIQADQKWKLRQEFEVLLGTDDVAEGVKRVKEMQGRKEVIHALMMALRGMIEAVEGDRMKNAIQRGKDVL